MISIHYAGIFNISITPSTHIHVYIFTPGGFAIVGTQRDSLRREQRYECETIDMGEEKGGKRINMSSFVCIESKTTSC